MIDPAVVTIVLLGLLAIAFGLYYDGRRDKDAKCPPHKWQDNGDGRLVCSRCNRRPGEIPEPRFFPPFGGGPA